MKFPRWTLPRIPFDGFGTPIDAQALSRTINDALSAAGLDPRSGPMKTVSDTIQRALADAGLGPAPSADDPEVIDVTARRTDASVAGAGPDASHPQLIRGSHVGPAGSRDYQLYVPASAAATGAARPLVVMLHGCTQSPDDFAAGTGMNLLADRHGFLVAYPAQSPNANGSKCWNWFRSRDQARDGGEPELIAGIVRDIVAAYPVDPKRIYVAGLSAGGAMAVILGQTHPELFAAVGVHSGLPYAAAHDVASAFAAMNTDPHGAARTRFVPTIVFHGDRDATVNAGNGAQLVAQALAGAPSTESSVEQGVSPGGSRYTRSVHSDRDGRPLIEQWVVHGAGHAWSGGDPAGSYTAPAGPDASRAMLQFFLAQTRDDAG